MLVRAESRALPIIGVPVLATIGMQLAYPLTHGEARDRLTIATVLTLAAASTGHATLTRGARGLACCAAAAVLGLAAEIAGVHTGVPFGHYAYAGTLGWQIADVPLVAALAWTMMAWPAAVVARTLAARVPARVMLGAWALASWDLFLDPQMVAAGHWRWAAPHPALPGVHAVPLTNLAGWLLVATLISLAVQGILRAGRHDDRWMYMIYVWTYVSSTLALLAFLHLQAAALWGAVGMGVVAIPLVARLDR